jgi:hypothetical protein
MRKSNSHRAKVKKLKEIKIKVLLLEDQAEEEFQ